MPAVGPFPSSRRARVLALVALASFAATVAAYVLAPSDTWTGTVLTAAAATWAGVVATGAAGVAWRLTADEARRRAWAWVTSGCALWLGGQLVWNFYELVLRVAPPYPSLADVGYLAIHPAVLVAVTLFLHAQPRRRFEPELWLDTVLVTFTAGAVGYVFLLQPLLAASPPFWPLAASVAWATGGIAVLWTILYQMMRRTRFPFGGAGVLATGLAVLCVASVLYATRALGGSVVVGPGIGVARDAGLLLVATAAAAVLDRPAEAEERTPPPTSLPRALALLLGLAGIIAIAAMGSLSARRELDIVVLTLIGGAIIAGRLAYSLHADRRYAEALEHEVAAQTRSLMDSLAATAAAERQLRLVMESVPDTIVLLDREGRAVDRNTPAAVTGAPPPNPPVGRSIFEFLEPDAARLVRENLAAAFEGEVRRFELPFVRDDKRRGTSAVLYAPVREGAKITRVLALARDITDVRRAEAQLQQAEKLAALGQLVSGVAHEINNPAAIISGFAQTLLLDELRPEQRDMVKMIHDEATRIGRITSNLLAFARAGGRERALVDLNDVVRRTFALRSYHLSTLNIAVTLTLDPSEPKIWGNGSEFQQIVLNLLINAEQALAEAGGPRRAITLRTTGTDAHVRLECEDTGPGIPEAIKGKIFDPFFTTKPEGLGTGLGLSICYGIVQEHGGRIWAESEAGHGARFLVELRRDPRTEARPAPAPARARQADRGALRVLIVDDEAGLRKAAARFLNRRGMQVRGVGDGAEALRALRVEEFDIILSDVRMPGMNGREFLERLRRDYPEYLSRLVFSTGDTYAADTAALLEEAGVPSLVKPFDFARLEELLREAAARPKVTTGA